MRKNKLIVLLVILSLCSCKSKQKAFTITGEYIPVTTTNKPDAELTAIVNKYKVILGKEMDKVIATAPHRMYTGRPESPLTNFTSDAMMKISSEQSLGMTPDIAFMNVNGIRAEIAAGEVTIGDIFAAFPFDNSLDLVVLKGKYVTELFESYANLGGAGISSNVKLVIKDKKVVSALVNGKPIDSEKDYTLITLDYLAEGNDGMKAMEKASKHIATGVKLRDYILTYVNQLTADSKMMEAPLDKRIEIID